MSWTPITLDWIRRRLAKARPAPLAAPVARVPTNPQAPPQPQLIVKPAAAAPPAAAGLWPAGQTPKLLADQAAAVQRQLNQQGQLLDARQNVRVSNVSVPQNVVTQIAPENWRRRQLIIGSTTASTLLVGPTSALSVGITNFGLVLAQNGVPLVVERSLWGVLTCVNWFAATQAPNIAIMVIETVDF